MNRRNGFTLVELVVVILILGILAGVAAPKMFDTSSKATDNGLRQSLAVIRDAIEMHVAQVGELPVCDATGGANFRTAIGKYIRGPFPKSPVGEKDFEITAVTGTTTTPDDATGWMYNNTNGTFIANCTEDSKTVSGVSYDEF